MKTLVLSLLLLYVLLFLTLLFSQEKSRIPKFKQVTVDDLIKTVGELHAQNDAQARYIMELQNTIMTIEKELESCNEKPK